MKTVVAPASGCTLPANAPALVYSATRDSSGAVVTPTPGTDLSLIIDGTKIPFTLQRQGDTALFFLVPSSSLKEGPASLELSYACGSLGTLTKMAAFTVGAAAAQPDDVGSLSVVSTGVEGEDKPLESGNCLESMRRAYANVTFAHGDRFAPVASTSNLLLKVDGKPFVELPYGTLGAAGSTAVKVFARCTRANVRGADELALGKHEVTAEITIAGGKTFSLPAVSVDLSCSSTPGDPRPASGGGGCSIGGAPGLGRPAPRAGSGPSVRANQAPTRPGLRRRGSGGFAHPVVDDAFQGFDRSRKGINKNWLIESAMK